jgi:hypothetical protein
MPFDNPREVPFGDIELLREARSRISGRGDWVQGRFRDGRRECLVAALSVVSGSRGFNMPNRTERRLARILAAHIPPRRLWTRIKILPARQRLIIFNDDLRTRHEDVLAVFDQAIERLMSKALVGVLA